MVGIRYCGVLGGDVGKMSGGDEGGEGGRLRGWLKGVG